MAEEKEEEKQPTTPNANLGMALSCLGALQVQLVQLMYDLDKANGTIAALKKEHEEKQKEFDEGKKTLGALQDELKFLKALMIKRPRVESHDPMRQPVWIKRFLSYHDWSRAEYSTLCCVSKAWRKYCQNILFARLQTIFLVDKRGCDEITKYLDQKKHLAEITTTIELSFKSHYGAVPGANDIQTYVPISVLDLLKVTKNVTSLSLTDMAAFIATPKVLEPVAQRLTSLTIDPQKYAGHRKNIEFSARPQGLFCGWKKLQNLAITRSQLLIVDKSKAVCPLVSLSLNQVLVSGSLWLMLQGARNSLTSLELMAVTGVMMDDLLTCLDEFGPNLKKLCLRSARYVSDFTERSFEEIFAKCTDLEHLNIDLAGLPINEAGKLLANQPKLTFLEVTRGEWVPMSDWRTLFGATSRSIKTLNIITSQYWTPNDLDKLQEKYRWMGVKEVHFIRTRAEE